MMIFMSFKKKRNKKHSQVCFLFPLQVSGLLEIIIALEEWSFLMGTPGFQCVLLLLTSRMQRLCVESWTVGLLYRFWEQLLLTKETLRCGHKKFSAEETNLTFTFVQNRHRNTYAPMMITKGCCVLVRFRLK